MYSNGWNGMQEEEAEAPDESHVQKKLPDSLRPKAATPLTAFSTNKAA
jgi:hypothetical protein